MRCDAFLEYYCAKSIPIAGTNRIDRFHRVPSDLRKYLEYTTKIKAKYGSVMRFVVKERLHWGDGDTDNLKPKGRPFEYDGSYISDDYSFKPLNLGKLLVG